MTPRTRGRHEATAAAQVGWSGTAPRACVAGIVLRRDEGVSALEYVLLGSLVAIAIILGARLLSGNLGNAYERVANVVGESL